MEEETFSTTSSDYYYKNSTAIYKTDDGDSYTFEYGSQLPDYFLTIYNVIIPLIMLVGVSGNIMVIMVILRTKDMHNSTNIYLANLAMADLMILLLWGSQQLHDMNNLEKNLVDLSKGYSIIFLRDALNFVSVLIILAISFERYYAICQPLKAGYICTKSRAHKICLLAWALAALSSSIQFSSAVYVPEEMKCTITGSLLVDVYYYASAAVFFFIPLIIITVLFIIIALHLKRAVAPGVNHAAMTHRRRVVTMLAVVVFNFFLCQLPLKVLLGLPTVVFNEFKLWLGVKASNSSLVLCQVMLIIHSAINPILYNFMSEKFRAGFKDICCHTVRTCFRQRRSRGSGRESSNIPATEMSTLVNLEPQVHL